MHPFLACQILTVMLMAGSTPCGSKHLHRDPQDHYYVTSKKELPIFSGRDEQQVAIRIQASPEASHVKLTSPYSWTV
jgi:hypothetical protein